MKYQNLIEVKQMEAKLPIERGYTGNFDRVPLDYAGYFEIKDCGKCKFQKDKNVQNVVINLIKKLKKMVFAKQERYGY